MKVAKPRTYRPIHLATLMTLTVIAVAITAIAAWLMWDAAKVPAKLITSPDLAVRAAQLRVDVIRNILAVGAGTGGLIALFLALRRQYVKERVDYDDQAHKNRTAEDSRHDAAERRITELYVKAAEQLGSEKAPVRMAALYSLERLAQDNPGHRGTVMSLICSYLRMPVGEPYSVQKLISDASAGTVDYSRDSVILEDLEVRKAAQDLINKHLWCFFLPDGRTAHGEDYWGALDLNLRGAILIDWNLASCKPGNLNIEGARFIGNADFSESFVDGSIAATGAFFMARLDFTGVRADGMINFRNAEFCEDVDFTKASFSRVGVFLGAVFRQRATFLDVSDDKLLLSESFANANPKRPHVWPKGFRLVPTDKAGIGVVKTLGQMEKDRNSVSD
ncbi:MULTISPECIES: pentapeptide repeat-containing protein [unclassified Micromonospora]|uniref:pentapeptide repeat-containing protein n=1 Tax=unclassified Micromonospora TaxID=2617518 RepID=UPI002FF2032E